MKLFILCLGFYLATLTLVKAQDSTQTVRKDKTALSDTTRIPDSIKAGNLPKDSAIHSIIDTTHNDSSQTATFRQQKTINSDTTAASQNTAPQDTIVDIFEEMKKAKQEQDRSMQEDKQKDARKEIILPTAKKDAAKSENQLDSSAINATDTATWFTIDSSRNDKATLGADSVSDPVADIAEKAEHPIRDTSDTAMEEQKDVFAQSVPTSTDSTSQNSADRDNNANKTTEKAGGFPSDDLTDSSAGSLTDHSTDSIAESFQSDADSHGNAADNDSAAFNRPARDTIQSLFTTVPAKPDEPDTIDVERLTDNKGSILNNTTPKASDSTSANTEQLVDSTRHEQDTAINEIFSDVEKEKAEKTNVTADISADNNTTGKRSADTDSVTAAPVDMLSSDDHNISTTDSSISNAAEDSAAERLAAGRLGLDSTINATEAIEPGTPFTQLFEPYRKFRKNTTIESTTNLTILQQHVNYKTKADFSTQFQRTGQEGAGYLFDVSVVRLNTEVETMGVQLKYDSNTPTDSTSTFAKPLFDIVGKRTYLKVDSTGKIMAVDTSQIGEQINTVLSGLSLSGGDYEVGSNFGLLLNNTEALKVGTSWQDSISQGDNQRVTTYKVQNLVDDEYIVLISGTVAQTGEIASDGVVFKTHFTGTQKGKMRVDKATRLIKTKEINLDMKGTVDYQDNELPASATSKIIEKVIEQ